ncbi:MAG: AAA family ATPase [Cyanobacteria bacterium P01_F01_bin.150]
MERHITRIKVDNLFGFLNHDIPLKNEKITFIHGPNGCGKTTLLKLISAFLKGDLLTLNLVRFDNIAIFYSTGEKCIISNYRKDDKYASSNYNIDLHFRLEKEDKIIENDKINVDREKFISDSQIDRVLTFLDKVGNDKWVNPRTGRLLLKEDIIEQYSDELILSEASQPQWFQSLNNGINLNFIQTQRLIKISSNHRRNRRFKYQKEKIDVVETYSDEMEEIIGKIFSKSAEISQSRERTFPKRLLDSRSGNEVSEQEIRDSYKKTEEKIEKLMSSGLIEKEKNISLPDSSFEQTEKKFYLCILKILMRNYLSMMICRKKLKYF